MARPNRRHQILKEARALYLADGVVGLSMRRLAQRVGITATAVYRHFRDKDALIDALAEQALVTFTASLERSNGGRRILEVPDNYVTYALGNPRDFELIFLERRRRVTRFPDDFAARRSESFEVLHDAVRQDNRKAPLTRAHSVEVALGIWALTHGLVMLRRAGRFKMSVASFRALCRRAVLRLIGTPASPRRRRR